MNKKGFTLLELIVVIIIIGILATLGLTQYGRMTERSRGAEARAILGDIRKFANAYRLENGTITPVAGNPSVVNIGANSDQIPSACRTSHYFSYAVTSSADPTLVITATRCAAGGKTPQGGPSGGLTLTLTSDVSTGIDSWGGTGNY